MQVKVWRKAVGSFIMPGNFTRERERKRERERERKKERKRERIVKKMLAHFMLRATFAEGVIPSSG